MDKNAIKKYAVWARGELIARVRVKALQYGITEKECGDPSAESVGGRLLTDAERRQRSALIKKIGEKDYQTVMEEAAYTWFNRFSALRFMEVNGYLPTHIRLFTDKDNKFKPQILTEAIRLDLPGLDMKKVYALKEADQTDELYKYLLIAQCNALSAVLPGMFQKIEDETELLFPENLLRTGSVIERMVTEIQEDDWRDAVQIIGWLYQYYNSEKKDAVFAELKKNVKITKENIPAATQLFTPDWIVRYMVENSLGRLWTEGHPDEKLKANWKYYLGEAPQEPEVQKQLAAIRKEYAAMKPEEIKCIDPCMGSGHILAYLFDVLLQIYESAGWTTREAVSSIVRNNLYGLDIDNRAGQLAYFTVMMKARKHDSRFLTRGIQPHVYAIAKSNHVAPYLADYFSDGDAELKKAVTTILEELHDADAYGSIITVTPQDWKKLDKRFDEIRADNNVLRDEVLESLLPLVEVAKTLAQKYDIVVTNPPYMGGSGMNTKLSNYVKKYYKDSKSDLFAVFIEKCRQLTAKNRFQAMITQHAWMFLSSFENLRAKLLHMDIVNMAHLGPRAFEEIGGEVVQTTSFVLRNDHIENYNSVYRRLIEPTTQQGKEDMFLRGENRFTAKQENFKKIPGSPIAYWVSDSLTNIFEGTLLGDYAQTKQGFATGNNDIFIRYWHEVSKDNAQLNSVTVEIAKNSRCKWFPCNKGGSYRKWYGNNVYVANWKNDGYEMREFAGSVIRNSQFYFIPGITWSSLANQLSLRYSPEGFIFESKGSMCYPYKSHYILYILGLLNSKTTKAALAILSPTLDFHEGPMSKVPFTDYENKDKITSLVRQNISLSKTDWDSFETSWDFQRHPLLPDDIQKN